MTVDNSWCTLKVDNDGIYALLCLKAPHGEENITVSEQHVLEFLEEQNVVNGINNIAIQAMLENVMYGQYVCIAKGKAATKGADGYYDYKKDMQDMKKKPVIQEDGTADYKNSLNLATIKEGELLAVYIPPTEGEEGLDVFGNYIKPLGKGKDLMPLRGRGIKTDDKINYYAEYSGHIVMDGPQLYIDKLFRVNGTMDIEVGNIKFEGDVEVCGDVRSGLEIEAKGSIYIHGHVGACKLSAGQNITIEKGTQGRDACEITAKGDIACKFVERSTLYAEGNIYADSVLNSRLTACQRIVIASKTGTVVGSEIYGMRGVVVKEAGNCAGTHTLLRSGLPREEYRKAGELRKAIQDTNAKVASFNEHLETIEATLKENPEIKEGKLIETRMQIMRAKIVLTSQIKEYGEELALLEERIKEDTRNSFINVTGVVYEGVRIYIGEYPYLVTEAVREVTYRVANSEVIATELIEPQK